MTRTTTHQEIAQTHPMDVAEDVLFGRDAPYERISDEEMVAEFRCHWCDLRCWFQWSDENHALTMALQLDGRVPESLRPMVYALTARVNEGLWMGHFDLCHEENMLFFRYTLLALPKPSQEAVELMIDTAVRECERFYPAFQSVVWGGKAPEEALQYALFETVGEC
jgi:hypothetical protein